MHSIGTISRVEMCRTPWISTFVAFLDTLVVGPKISLEEPSTLHSTRTWPISTRSALKLFQENLRNTSLLIQFWKMTTKVQFPLSFSIIVRHPDCQITSSYWRRAARLCYWGICKLDLTVVWGMERGWLCGSLWRGQWSVKFRWDRTRECEFSSQEYHIMTGLRISPSQL